MDDMTRDRLLDGLADLRARLPRTIRLDDDIRDAAIVEALAAYQVDPDGIPVTGSDPVQGIEYQSPKEEDKPETFLNGDVVEIRWRRPTGDVVLELARLTTGDWARTVTIEGVNLPETVLGSAVTGPLGRIVEFPGAYGYRIADYTQNDDSVRLQLVAA